MADSEITTVIINSTQAYVNALLNDVPSRAQLIFPNYTILTPSTDPPIMSVYLRANTWYYFQIENFIRKSGNQSARVVFSANDLSQIRGFYSNFNSYNGGVNQTSLLTLFEFNRLAAGSTSGSVSINNSTSSAFMGISGILSINSSVSQTFTMTYSSNQNFQLPLRNPSFVRYVKSVK
jgi:hypothetical protein